jgi:hypothetical protein
MHRTKQPCAWCALPRRGRAPTAPKSNRSALHSSASRLSEIHLKVLLQAAFADSQSDARKPVRNAG